MGLKKKFLKLNPHHITSFSAFGEMFEVVSKHLRIKEKQNFRRKLFSKFNEIETVVLRDLLYSISNLLIFWCKCQLPLLRSVSFFSQEKYNNSIWSETPKNFVNNDWRMENRSKPKKIWCNSFGSIQRYLGFT